MNRLREKTTATLLIAIFMISAFAVAYATDGTYLVVSSGDPAGTEDRIVLDMPEGFTLGDIETISWSIYAITGAPVHLDITLDTTDTNQRMLNAEISYNNPLNEEWTTGLSAEYTYNIWLETFEYAVDTGETEINDDTMLWLCALGSGDDNAPWGTLADWKDGVVANDPLGYFTNGGTLEIDSETPVLKLEFEIDSWISIPEVYIKDIMINGEGAGVAMRTLVMEFIPTISITVDPAFVYFGEIVQGQPSASMPVTITSSSDVDVDVSASATPGLYADHLELTVETTPYTVAGFDITILEGQSAAVGLVLKVPLSAPTGLQEGTLVFWAEEASG